MGMTVKIRKWGNSLGVILPKEMVNTQKLKAGQEVSISVFREHDLRSAFGSAPEMKQLSREEFHKDRKRGWHD
jgi:antitoxin component of MazEF toxin-antitoxin module